MIRDSTADVRQRSDGRWAAPGFFDLQVNGFAGVDYNSPEASLEDIRRSILALRATGVTRFLPTVITGSPERMAGACRNLARARREIAEGVSIAGIHVEGPWISPEEGPRGAHPREHVRPPSREEFLRLQDAAAGDVRLLTLAPEVPGAVALIEFLVTRGVVVALGHTAATTTQISDAVRAGATVSTHLGNGAHSILPRHPNYIWDQMADDALYASLIVDGIHLPPSFVKCAVRAKGLDRSILVTDATMCAGCAPGRYRLGEVEVELDASQRVRMVGTDRLAGSALRMDRGVENLMRFAGLDLAAAVGLASGNPARALGLDPTGNGQVVFRYDPSPPRITVEETLIG